MHFKKRHCTGVDLGGFGIKYICVTTHIWKQTIFLIFIFYLNASNRASALLDFIGSFKSKTINL